MKTMLCLVSAQAAANLLPALDPSLRPQQVLLLVSDKMQAAADALTVVFTELGIKSQRIRLENEHDYQAIEQTLLEVAAAHESDGITLNLTGGTKLIALVAHSVGKAANWPSFYVDIDTDSLIWLDEKKPAQKLGEQLRLRHYLRAYGSHFTETPQHPQTSRAERELMHSIVKEIGSFEKPITQINWLAQQAEDQRQLTSRMPQDLYDSPNLDALLRLFREASLLRTEKDKLIFVDEKARAFAKGGWLEHYVYDCVAGVSGRLGIRDKAIGLTVSGVAGAKNEVDVAILARNRFFAIECKTGRMDKPEAPKANDALFKLAEICRRLGGIGARGMLASYRPLRDAEKKLARALNVELVCGRELADLSGRLQNWIGC